MGLFNSGKIKKENERLSEENQRMQSMMTPEMQSAAAIQEYIANLTKQKDNLELDITSKNLILQQINAEIEEKKKYVIELDDNILLQDFGLYTPIYNLMNSQAYKDKLLLVREREKALIKNNMACRFPTNFTLNGSASQGKKMISDNVKQIIRSFNDECDSIIDKVKFNNVEIGRASCRERV